MNSIRPLVTITILVVVGAYLYVKINEGAVHSKLGGDTQWNQSADGVPPLAFADEPPATEVAQAPAAETSPVAPSAAPPFAVEAAPATTEPGAISPAPLAAATAPLGAAPLATTPAVPPIPAVPQISTTAPSTAAELNSVPIPSELPANIPTARYPDDPAVNPIAPATDVAATLGVGGIVPPPATADTNPLREPVTPPAETDRYGVPAPIPTATTTAPAPPQDTFAASWPAIQASLDRGDLATAHQQLSRWYDDPSLTPTDAEKVESLLSQLAGTVIYSTEHKLAPAHIVQPGETLESIAKQYEVPWQLLAKINGIPAADQVRPGQELKVVRGPFSAVVDLARNRITLVVDGRYAGRFNVNVPRGAESPTGNWYVQGKPVPSSAASPRQILLANDDAPGDSKHLSLVGGDPAIDLNSAAGPTLTVAPADVEELSDILSIGSRILIRR